ncbi:GTPase HflX [Candidatus Bathyarchaeota archaeon]|nr:GTPase HflX [Candidatus Bathyarchaeota archaeon]
MIPAIIVQRRLPHESSNLNELKGLAESADYSVVYAIEQVREPDAAYQVGKGKAEEIAKIVKELGAEKIIFDNDLKPIQAYNLAKLTGVEAIDRFQLILEIFAKRAHTKDAQLQIQLAKLRYELAHAREKVRLAKMGEQPGFHGLGKYEVDVYYEMIHRQMDRIKNEIKRIRKKRGLRRKRRLELGFSLVALAGYTNAGKSTLFNALTCEEVPVGEGLFTTLSTTTRAVKFNGKRVLLTDTVGFIDRLPIALIEAFRATLEDTIFSDAIILVVDISESIQELQRKLSCSLNTIQEIGAGGIPIITGMNKIDLISPSELERRMAYLQGIAPNPVAISSLYRKNLDLLCEEVARNLEDYIKASFVIPNNQATMSFLSWLHGQANVSTVNYESDRVVVEMEALPRFIGLIQGKVKQLGGTFIYLKE